MTAQRIGAGIGSSLTAKGDIQTYTTTPARLAVGADGTVLTANSSAATGLSYQPLNSAGKNAIINGGMDIWQRGTSFSVGGFTADHWVVGTGGTVTISQDATSVPTGFRYSQKYLTSAASSFANFATFIETANIIPFRGQVCTVSWYAIKNATYSGTFGLSNIFYSNTTDAAASQLTAVTITSGANQTPTTSWARYTATFTVPSDAMGLSIQFNNGLAQASGAQINFVGAMMELGSVATTFSRAGGTIQGELAACQRYFETSYDVGTAPGTSTSNGAVWSSQTASNVTSGYIGAACQMKVTKRATPTIVLYDAVGASGTMTRITLGGSQANASLATAAAIGLNNFVAYSAGSSSYAGILFQYTASSEL